MTAAMRSRERGFGGQGDEGEQEIRQRYLAGRALEKPGLAGHGVGVQPGDLSADLLEVGSQCVCNRNRGGS